MSQKSYLQSVSQSVRGETGFPPSPALHVYVCMRPLAFFSFPSPRGYISWVGVSVLQSDYIFCSTREYVTSAMWVACVLGLVLAEVKAQELGTKGKGQMHVAGCAIGCCLRLRSPPDFSL